MHVRTSDNEFEEGFAYNATYTRFFGGLLGDIELQFNSLGSDCATSRMNGVFTRPLGSAL